jgi:hypothetical protein
MRLAAGGRAQQQGHVFRRENAQDGIDDSGFANSRPAGDHEHLGTKRNRDRGFLAFRKIGAGGAHHIVGKFKPLVLGEIHAAGDTLR